MCSLIPDQLRSPEAGYSLTADGASGGACLPPQPEGGERGGMRWGEGALRFCGSLATTAPKVAILLMPKS